MLVFAAIMAVSPPLINAATSSSQTNFSIDPNHWYDIDGDGKMEWVSSGKLYKLSSDNYGQTEINNKFVSSHSTHKNIIWCNLGRGENVDILVPRYLSNSSSLSLVYKVDDGTATEWLNINANLSRIDYNNDGQTDLWIKNSNSLRDQEVLTYGPEGDFRKEYINIMSLPEYLDYWISLPGSIGVGFGYWSVPLDPPGSFGDYRQIDLNNDGFLDFVDADSGVCLINLGNGCFVSESIGGSVLFRDFDGDGMCDQFVYTKSDKAISIFLQRVGEEAQEVKLFSGFACSDNIWCRDFDKDGDIDILVPFNASDNKGYAYLLMFENDGKGNFKKHEYYIDGDKYFQACVDVDADGEYEVIASGSDEKGSKGLFCYSLKGLQIDTSPLFIDDYKSSSDKLLVGDPANTGSIFLINPYATPQVYSFEGMNTPPERPDAPSVDYDPSKGCVKVSWGLGTDKETAPLDLTYELRIGTAPDKADILWADALPDGTRRRLGQGNTGYGHVRTFNADYWPEGKIYVSLQVVDDNGMGSPFSEYTVFEKMEPSVGFTVSGPEMTAVNDTVTLELLSPSSASYKWDCDGASIISQSDTSISLLWKTPGIKKVRLKAVGQTGYSSEITKEVEVVPARLEKVFSDYVYSAFDMDGDGSTELYAKQFLEGDADGVYTPVKRLFNSNLPSLHNMTVTDINKDGRPDVVSPNCQLLNEGDKSMEIRDEKCKYDLTVDFDNDGFMDVAPTLRNSGNYIDFIATGTPGFSSYASYYDYDNDGLVDIIQSNGIYKNQGDFSFELLESFELDDFDETVTVGDIDGDGKPDMAWTNAGFWKGVSKYAMTAHIRWNDGELTDIEAPAGYKFYKLNMFDFDNNGTQDLIIDLAASAGNSFSAYVIVYIYPDRTWNMVKYTKERHETFISDLYDFSLICHYHRTDGKLGYSSYAVTGPDNTPPTPPSNIRVERNDGFLVIEWDPSSDAENPSAALKYNISIKHKDREGEGSYFLSPLNFGRNGVHIPSQTTLINGTKFTIPIDRIPNGEYEIKVQSVDTQWQESEFSETLEYKLDTSPFISIPEATMVGQETPIRLRAGVSAEDMDFGPDAEVTDMVSDIVYVRWSTEGDKIIYCNGYETHIFVHPALDASFSIPEVVYEYDRIRIECDNTHNSSWSWRYADYPYDFWPFDWELISKIDDSNIELTILPYNEKIEIKHTLTEDYGIAESLSVIEIQEHPKPITVSKILFDHEQEKYVLYWEVPEHLFNLATGVNIYKEMYNRDVNDYIVTHIATLPIENNNFIDVYTNLYEWEYYSISYAYSYGESLTASFELPIHAHVELNMDDNWDLSWNRSYYNDSGCFRIMRGSSPYDMAPIDNVSLDLSSYTDLNTDGQQYYYRVDLLENENDPESVCRMSNTVLTPEHPAGVGYLVSDRNQLSILHEGKGGRYHISGMPESGGRPGVVEIYDLNGIRLYHDTFDTSSVTIDLTELLDGVYILKVLGENTIQTARFIKRD
ncbi:MAG: T9SS type A sorting domain-containing protein [Muribaculaceae bacterium]|nr:T9SS type A sorting domain-containing protein [Muribaculaceae bacterium]